MIPIPVEQLPQFGWKKALNEALTRRDNKQREVDHKKVSRIQIG
jgi:hypothetical protein